MELPSLKTYFGEKKDTTLAGIIEKIRKLSKSSKIYNSHVITLLKILLVLPVTNAVSEQFTSTCVELKTGFGYQRHREDLTTVCCLLFTKK